MANDFGFIPTEDADYYFISYNSEDTDRVAAIARALHDNGFHLWYDRGIEAGDLWEKTIAEKIRSAKGVILFFTRGILPKKDSFVKKEYTIAASHYDRPLYIVMMDQIDNRDIPEDKVLWWVDMNDRQAIDVRNITDMSKLVGQIIERIGSSAARETSQQTQNRHLLSSGYLPVKPYFCGRQNILDEIEQKYHAGRKAVFLYGIGGIGKTEIALQYALAHRNEYDVIIHAVCENSLRDLVIAEQPFELRPPLPRKIIDTAPEEDGSYFERKLQELRRTATPQTLLILDNLDNLQDPDLPRILDGPWQILATTRINCSREYTAIPVKEIEDMNDLITVFTQNYQGFDVEPDDPDLPALIRLVNCHTYTVILLAHHMENSGQSVRQMIDALQTEGITSLNETVHVSGASADTAYENLVRMFKVFSLSSEEQAVLKLLSLIPLCGIPAMKFKKWADLKDTRILHRLEMRGWIMRNAGGITLHPVVRKVIQYQLPVHASEIRSFLDNAAEDLKVSWFLTQAQKEQYSMILESILSAVGPVSEDTVALCRSARNIYGFAGQAEKSVRLSEEIYRYYLDTIGEYALDTASLCYGIGWTLLFNPSVENAMDRAEEWLMRALRLYRKIDPSDYNACVTYGGLQENISKYYSMRYDTSSDPEDFEHAKEYAESAVEYARAHFTDPETRFRCAGSLLRYADICMAMQDYAKAKALVDEAYDLLVQRGAATWGERNPDILRATSRRAKILYAEGKYREALAEIDLNLSAYLQFYNESNLSYFDQLVLKVSCCARLGLAEQTEEARQTALNTGYKIFSEDSPRLKNLISLSTKAE